MEKVKINFKFELGDIVSHKSDNYKKMMIISRCYEESNAGIEASYMVSSCDMGQVVRQRVSEFEIVLTPKKN